MIETIDSIRSSHKENGKKLYNERGITFFHETERYVNNLNIYNRSKNGTNLWDDLICIVYVEVVTTSTKTPHLVFSVFSSAEAIDGK